MVVFGRARCLLVRAYGRLLRRGAWSGGTTDGFAWTRIPDTLRIQRIYMYAPRSHMGLRGAIGLYAEAGYAKDVSVMTPCGEMRALRPF